MHKLVIVALSALALLAACGGGGGSGGGVTPPPPPPTQVIATPGPPNVETMTIDAGPAALVVPALNTAFVSVTVCVPGSNQCQTIDHIEVDTGSSGLRILSETLTMITLPVNKTAGGMDFAECLPFADGSSFGPLATADIRLPVSTKQATNVNVQVIGAPGYTVPNDCTGKKENTVPDFGANGILGVGPFLQDCGSVCANAQSFPPGAYYTCPTPATCAAAAATLAEQVANPVSLFATDNNGVIVELPTVASGGATTVAGSLVFGIGTQTNNALGSATVLFADPTNAFIQVTYKGTIFNRGYIDSGSNGYFFTDNSITVCTTGATGFYCPSSTLPGLQATLKGTNATTVSATFSIVNANDALSANLAASAMPDIGAPGPDMTLFDFGLPHFFGRNVFTAIEGQATPAGMGPYFAY